MCLQAPEKRLLTPEKVDNLRKGECGEDDLCCESAFEQFWNAVNELPDTDDVDTAILTPNVPSAMIDRRDASPQVEDAAPPEGGDGGGGGSPLDRPKSEVADLRAVVDKTTRTRKTPPDDPDADGGSEGDESHEEDDQADDEVDSPKSEVADLRAMLGNKNAQIEHMRQLGYKDQDEKNTMFVEIRDLRVRLSRTRAQLATAKAREDHCGYDPAQDFPQGFPRGYSPGAFSDQHQADERVQNDCWGGPDDTRFGDGQHHHEGPQPWGGRTALQRKNWDLQSKPTRTSAQLDGRQNEGERTQGDDGAAYSRVDGTPCSRAEFVALYGYDPTTCCAYSRVDETPCSRAEFVALYSATQSSAPTAAASSTRRAIAATAATEGVTFGGKLGPIPGNRHGGAASIAMAALTRGGAASATAKALPAWSNGRKTERAQQHGQRQVHILLLAFTAEQALENMRRVTRQSSPAARAGLCPDPRILPIPVGAGA